MRECVKRKWHLDESKRYINFFKGGTANEHEGHRRKKKKEKEKEKHIYLSMCKCQCHSLNCVRKLIMPLLAKGRQKLIKRGKVVKVLLLFIVHNSVVVKDVYVDNKDKSFLQNGVYQKKSELKMYRSNES